MSGRLICLFVTSLLFAHEAHGDELRKCAHRKADTKLFADMTYYADSDGRVVKVAMAYKGRSPITAEYVWQGDRIVAERKPGSSLKKASWEQPGFVARLGRDKWEADGRVGKRTDRVTATPLAIGSLSMSVFRDQPFVVPGFTGTIRQTSGGVYFQHDTVYKNGRMIRWIDRPLTAKHKQRTAKLSWDAKGRLTKITIRPKPRKGVKWYRFEWDGTKLQRVVMRGERNRMIYEYKHDDHNRVTRFVMKSAGETLVTFTYDYSCDDIKPHPAINGIDLHQN